jgi:hypothetical protein
MTTDTLAPIPPTTTRELSDAELEAVAAGKMRGVAETESSAGYNPYTGGAQRTTTSSYQRFRGFRPGLG